MTRSDISHYPSILKLKTIEFEINMLLKAYKTAHATYLQNIVSKNYIDAAKNLAELTTINNMIETNVENGQELLAKIIPEGSFDQELVSVQDPRLKKIARQVKRQQKDVKCLQNELTNIDGELNTTEISQQSNYLQFIILVIVGIVISGLTIKTIITKDESSLDTAILAIIIGIIIYFVIKKFIN